MAGSIFKYSVSDDQYKPNVFKQKKKKKFKNGNFIHLQMKTDNEMITVEHFYDVP